MGHEHYTSLDQAAGPGPRHLARRLLQTGQVDSVHVYGNIVTVDLHKGYTGDSLSPIIEDLYTYCREGSCPGPRAAGRGGARGRWRRRSGAAEGRAAVDSRVPAHLLERSRQAKERWLANQC